jgi:hypothetical protein
MDHNKLLALWNTDDSPTCAEGIMLAKAPLKELVALGTEESLDRLNDIKAHYMALVEHGEDCDKCNEV